MWLNILKASYGKVGIIHTCMYPAAYYVGPFFHSKDEPIPQDNATCNYHRTLDEAKNELRAQVANRLI